MRRFLKSGPLLTGFALAAACGLIADDGMGARGRDENPIPPLPWHTFEVSGPVSFSASASWQAGRDIPLQAFLEIHNPADTELVLETGPCGFGLRAHSAPPGSGELVWDDRPPVLRSNASWACNDVGVVFTVAPGESQIVPVHEYGLPEYASLPAPGRYVFAVVLEDRDRVSHVVPTDPVSVD